MTPIELESRMAALSEVSGVPRQILDKTNVLVLVALQTAIIERDRARRSAEGEIDLTTDESRAASWPLLVQHT